MPLYVCGSLRSTRCAAVSALVAAMRMRILWVRVPECVYQPFRDAQITTRRTSFIVLVTHRHTHTHRTCNFLEIKTKLHPKAPRPTAWSTWCSVVCATRMLRNATGLAWIYRAHTQFRCHYGAFTTTNADAVAVAVAADDGSNDADDRKRHIVCHFGGVWGLVVSACLCLSAGFHCLCKTSGGGSLSYIGWCTSACKHIPSHECVHAHKQPLLPATCTHTCRQPVLNVNNHYALVPRTRSLLCGCMCVCVQHVLVSSHTAEATHP